MLSIPFFQLSCFFLCRTQVKLSHFALRSKLYLKAIRSAFDEFRALKKMQLRNISYQIIPHEGKSDLRKSIPRKLKTWRTPNTHFIVLHDHDSNDCRQLKQELSRVCLQTGRHDVLIRIVCHELESWYFGDLKAVEQAFGVSDLQKKLKLKGKKHYYNQPDLILKPSQGLEKLVAGFQKGLAARMIPHYMDIHSNASPSFQTFIQGVKRLCRTTV